MTRFVWPRLMQLFAVDRSDVLGQDARLRPLGYTAVALRWSTRPVLGFPVRPFDVWRRPRVNYPFEKVAEAVRVRTTHNFEWGLRPMVYVLVQTTPAAGTTLTLAALDSRRVPIPGHTVVTSGGPVLFHANGIAALRVTGTGVVNAIAVISASALANADGWVRFDRVGFPYRVGEVDPGRYVVGPQGPPIVSLDGVGAAILRLRIAQILHQPPPALPAADLGAVDWPAPEPEPFLGLLRHSDNILPMITRCLQETSNAHLGHRAFRRAIAVAGMRQIGQRGGGTADATAAVPVVGMTQLLVAADGFAATALGYGTIDLALPDQPAQPDQPTPPPPPPAPANFTHASFSPYASLRATDPFRAGFDYMVTGEFDLPLVGRVVVAALADTRSEAEAPGLLSLNVRHANRPSEMDGEGSEAVRLMWRLPEVPTSYAIVASRRSGQHTVINPSRDGGGGYDPYLPERPQAVDGRMPATIFASFMDPVAPVPVAGSVTHRYAVAGLDVFGRWTQWRMASRSVPAPPPQVPTILQVELRPDGPVSGTVITGSIEVTIGWNAEDRSADRFELFGRFIPRTATPEESFTAGFLNGDSASTPVIARLHGTAPISERSATPVRIVQPDEGADSAIQRYRITIPNTRFDFAGTTRIVFVVWARAYERVQPARSSELSRPVRGEGVDPRPPAVPAPLPGLIWTALPDATGTARGVITLGPDRASGGYVLWEATETALRAALELPEPVPGSSLAQRALELEARIALPQAEARLAGVFARWNDELLDQGRVEVPLPGASDILYVYRVSAIGENNRESERTEDAVFLAVPTRVAPGVPSLRAGRVRDASGDRIRLVVSPGQGSAPVGFRLYRSRRSDLARELGSMGPAVAREDDAGWAVDGDARAFEDDQTPTWKPIYYRAVAITADDPSNGRYGGTSAPSPALRVLYPPREQPFISEISVHSGELRFRAAVPDYETPIGRAYIEVQHLRVDGPQPVRVTLAGADPASVAQGPATHSVFGREATAEGSMWSLRVDALGAGATLVVVVTDPLGRSTEQTVQL
jgi:hypothetical protein